VVNFGAFGTVISAIELLRGVLEKSGIDKSKAAQIVGEFMSKMKLKGTASESREQETGTGAAFAEEPWEYSVVTLAYVKPRRGTKSLAPKLRDGVQISGKEPPELAAYLNQASEDRWEIVAELGGSEAPTLLLGREKR
jgi:hypothetical protein